AWAAAYRRYLRTAVRIPVRLTLIRGGLSVSTDAAPALLFIMINRINIIIRHGGNQCQECGYQVKPWVDKGRPYPSVKGWLWSSIVRSCGRRLEWGSPNAAIWWPKKSSD